MFHKTFHSMTAGETTATKNPNNNKNKRKKEEQCRIKQCKDSRLWSSSLCMSKRAAVEAQQEMMEK